MNDLKKPKYEKIVPYLTNSKEKMENSEPKVLLNKVRRNKTRLDSTDVALLKILSADSMLTASEISKKLKAQKIQMTERGIRKRITTLQKHGIIKSHTILIDDSFAGRTIRRIILVKFKNTQNFVQRLEKYKQYLEESPYCTFAVRIRGDLDWLHYKCFPTKELADHEDDIFRSIFGDIMQEYRSYDAEIMKSDFSQILEEDTVQRYIEKYMNNITK